MPGFCPSSLRAEGRTRPEEEPGKSQRRLREQKKREEEGPGSGDGVGEDWWRNPAKLEKNAARKGRKEKEAERSQGGEEPGRSRGRSQRRGGAGGGAGRSRTRGGARGEASTASAAAAAAATTFGAGSPRVVPTAGALPQPPLPGAPALVAPADEDPPRAPRELPPPPSASGAGMELFQAKDHYILQQGERALWCSRRDGGLQLRPGEAGGARSPWAGWSGRGARRGRGRAPQSPASERAPPAALAGGHERGRASCHYFLTEGVLASSLPLRGDKGPATLVPQRAPPRRESPLLPGGADPSCQQSGSGRLPPESSSEVPLALKAFSTVERPLARPDKCWVRIPGSGQKQSRPFTGTSVLPALTLLTSVFLVPL